MKVSGPKLPAAQPPTRERARRRQNVAVAALIGLAAVAVALWLLVRDADDSPAPAPQASVPELSERERAAERGIRVRWPRAWSRRDEEGVIQLRSPDRSASVLIAAPTSEGRVGRVLDGELDALRSSLRRVEVRPGERREVGGLEARGAVVSGRNRAGEPVRILLAVTSGKRRTYVVQVLTHAAADERRLVEAQLILNSLRLSG